MDETKSDGVSVVMLSGPTASGKTSVSIPFAESINAEILNIDSVQFYSGMDIGSAKPTKQEQGSIPHHLFDVLAPDQHADVRTVCDLVCTKAKEVASRGKTPLLVGSSGLYVTALRCGLSNLPSADKAFRKELENIPTDILHKRLTTLDPERASDLHPHDRNRVVRALELCTLSGKTVATLLRNDSRIPFVQGPMFVLFPERQWLYDRINLRSEHMISKGIVEETALLIKKYGPALSLLKTIGYRQCQAYLQGTLSERLLCEEIAKATRRYAKRQYTFWKNEPLKRGWSVIEHIVPGDFSQKDVIVGIMKKTIDLSSEESHPNGSAVNMICGVS